MDSRILSPIPTPPAQRWREIRLLYLPRTMFVVGVVVAVWLWRASVAPGAIVAEAEVVGADARPVQAGVLSSLNVTLNQTVKAGEIIGQISSLNPRLLDSTLAVIRAEVGMLIAADKQRVALEFERLQLDWITQRVNRAEILGRLQQTEADLARAEPLYRAKLITEENYAQLKLARETLTAQAEERSKLVERLAPGQRAASVADAQAAALSGESALAAAIKVQDAKLKLTEDQLMPLPLVAPIDGVVSLVLRRAGETVVAGEPVVRVTAPKSERLAGYVRQPLAFDPKPGMAAQIRTRNTPPKVAATTITHVGPALELLSPTVLTAMRLPPTPLPETALRIEFSLPAGLNLRPGEHVDVILQ